MTIRLLGLPALVLLAACTTTPAPAPPSTAQHCDAEAVQSHLGKAASAEIVEAARKAAGAEIARTLKPGQMVTMEYRDGRLNLSVDAANVIVRITCG